MTHRHTLTITAGMLVAAAGGVAVLAGATGASGDPKAEHGRPNRPPPAEVPVANGTPPPAPPRAPTPDDVVVVNVVRGGRTYPLRLHPERRVTIDEHGNLNEEVVLDAGEAKDQLRSLGVASD